MVVNIATNYPQVYSFLTTLRYEKKYSPNTIVAYEADLEQFFAYIINQFEAPELQRISASFVRSWLAELKNDKLTTKSIRRKASTLQSFFKYLLKNKTVKATPTSTITLPKVSKRLPQFVNEKNLEQLFYYTEFSSDWNGATEKIMMQILYQTGIRVSELVNLQCQQIDIGNKRLKVLGKGNKERIIPLADSMLKQLHSYSINRSSLEFVSNPSFFVTEKGLPYTRQKVYNFVKKHLSNITTIDKKSPHIFRHSFATHLMNHGADLNAVKELLGHSSLASTQVYTHNNIDKLKKVFADAHPKA